MQTLRHDISQLISKSGRLSLSELADSPCFGYIGDHETGKNHSE